jgi:hypothetical protein
MYCECFAGSAYCDPSCSCRDCHNRQATEALRLAAIRAVLERNPDAFRAKVAADADPAAEAPVTKHSKGCHCRKTGCLKKYCECFQAGVDCSDRCGCLECRNVGGNAERELLRVHSAADGSVSSDTGPPSPAKRPRTASSDTATDGGDPAHPPPSPKRPASTVATATASAVTRPGSPVRNSGAAGAHAASVGTPAAGGGGTGVGVLSAPRDADAALERRLYVSLLQQEQLLRFSEVLMVAAEEAERAALASRAALVPAPAGAEALACVEPDALVSPAMQARTRRAFMC